MRRRSVAFVVLGALCALLPSVAMWGFTVDDALIPVRYAHHLGEGAGYRFDVGGPVTDGVTPLPWAFLLVPLTGHGAMTTLVGAKMLGVVAWTVAGAFLGDRVGSVAGRGPGGRALAAASLLVVALAFPIGAWAASGMETGLATALATVATTRLHRPRQVALLAGLAATLRPELVVWALALAGGAALAAFGDGASRAGERDPRGAAGRRALLEAIVVAGAPFALCAAVRLLVFGRPGPLALLAKPSDLEHGANYVVAAGVVLLTPILALAPLALWKRRGPALVVVSAFVAHALVVLLVGGDWMPYGRLMVVVAPSLAIAFVELAASMHPLGSGSRVAVAAALGVTLAARAAPAGRGVQADREALVARARPALAGAKVVAALDVGWVGASTDATIVDLAGLTDPAIALLPGGHTSKRIDASMLLDRGVDVVVVYSDSRVVERRLLASELFASRFGAAETLPLGSRGAFYTLYRRRLR